MPLKIVPPREGKSPNFSIRGTYLGRYVDRSARTGKRSVAQQVLKSLERQIERGEFSERGEATFASAATGYMKAGGERTYMTPLLKHFGMTPARQIDQAAINAAALALYPDASPATRNRQVYTPCSAVLRSAGIRIELKRPEGAQGRRMTNWLWPEQAFRLFVEADKLNAEFGVLLRTLCYTGMRLSEALALTWDRVRLQEGFAYLLTSKNDEPRGIFLPPVVVAALGNLDPSDSGRVFSLRKSGHLYSLLRVAAIRAEVDLPERSAFHVFCHTWATWMRRYGGLDTKGLVATMRWKDRKSADRYEHVVVSEEAARAALLPTPNMREAI
jgi:integrase